MWLWRESKRASGRTQIWFGYAHHREICATQVKDALPGGIYCSGP
jgi:hypothetical protein